MAFANLVEGSGLGGRSLQSKGGGCVLLTRDVPQMVDYVVQEVLDEGRNGELGTVGPDATS
jgi:hypothetical protein